MTLNVFVPQFLHLAGLIIGLGAVTVIDTLGFTARKSIQGTQTTINAHHVTKPLIWLGTSLMIIGWMFLYDGSLYANIKTAILPILIINGGFLSTYISPRLDHHRGKKKLLPPSLQHKIATSMIISFISWWSIVILTLLHQS